MPGISKLTAIAVYDPVAAVKRDDTAVYMETECRILDRDIIRQRYTGGKDITAADYREFMA